MKERIEEKKDLLLYTRILNMQDRHRKEFFDCGGCGVEIEFGVEYEKRCRVYIETGLRKLKAFVGERGKFTTDPSIGSFLNVEIVLRPYPRAELEPLIRGIEDIIGFYENFVFNDHCGVHANFRADDALKEKYYNLLTDGRYDSGRFRHSKYKVDFMQSVRNRDGSLKSYAEYLEYQHNVGAKYCGVNFMKDRLLEVRTLNLAWEDVSFFYDVYDEAVRALAAVNKEEGE